MNSSVSQRFGTGQLCQGYIRLLTSLLDQLDLTVFSLPSLLLSLLLRRLLLLAGPQAAPQQTSPWLSALVPQLAASPPRPQIYLRWSILSNDGHKIILWTTSHKMIF
jgi:hypothetical protein